MIRSLAVLVGVVGLLAVANTPRAALLVFDVSGTGSVNEISGFAPPPGYFISAFGPGSSVSVETDTNGDSIVGDVSLLGGTLNTSRFFELGALGAISTNSVAFMTGGEGALIGGGIVWSSPTSFSEVGTFRCFGAICENGVDHPIGGWLALMSIEPPTDPTPLGRWDLDAAMSTILGSSRAISALGAAGSPASWYLFGSNDLGFPVPEPGAFALVLIGLGGLALRRCKGPGQSPGRSD